MCRQRCWAAGNCSPPVWDLRGKEENFSPATTGRQRREEEEGSLQPPCYRPGHAGSRRAKSRLQNREPPARRSAGPAICKPAELNAFGRGKQRAVLRAEPPGWVNTLWKRWQQAISPSAAGTPRWLEIKQVLVRTEPSPRPPAGLLQGEGFGEPALIPR